MEGQSRERSLGDTGGGFYLKGKIPQPKTRGWELPRLSRHLF